MKKIFGFALIAAGLAALGFTTAPKTGDDYKADQAPPVIRTGAATPSAASPTPKVNISGVSRHRVTADGINQDNVAESLHRLESEIQNDKREMTKLDR
jgi:hypothetical protein